MRIAEFTALLVGRSLAAEEVTMMNCLSMQGMAKLNTDLDRGFAVEHILNDLKSVYRAMMARRAEAVEALPTPLLAMLAEMEAKHSTVFSASELAVMRDRFLVGISPFPVKNEALFEEGCELDELVHKFHGALMLEDLVCAVLPANTSIIFNQLVVTHQPRAVKTVAGTKVTTPNTNVPEPRTVSTSPVFRFNDIGKSLVGISPVVSWFSEKPCPPLEISTREATLQLRDKLVAQANAAKVASVATGATNNIDPMSPNGSIELGFPMMSATISSSASSAPFLPRRETPRQQHLPQSSTNALSMVISEPADKRSALYLIPSSPTDDGAKRPPPPGLLGLIDSVIRADAVAPKKTVRFRLVSDDVVTPPSNASTSGRIGYPVSPVSEKYQSAFLKNERLAEESALSSSRLSTITATSTTATSSSSSALALPPSPCPSSRQTLGPRTTMTKRWRRLFISCIPLRRSNPKEISQRQ